MDKVTTSKPAGYQWFIDHYGLNCLPADRISRVAGVSVPRLINNYITATGEHVTLQTFPWRYLKADTFQHHLEFALKNEELNPGILKAVFRAVGPELVEQYVRAAPTGQYTRRAWFLYEWLLGKQLDIPNLNTGNNIELVAPEDYYCANSLPSARHRVLNNIAGVPGFCPMFRRSEFLDSIMAKDLPRHLMVQLRQHSQDVLTRAVSYLYAKESETSSLIERETPSAERATRFIDLLRGAGEDTPLTAQAIIDIQAAIIDERKLRHGYGWRAVQGYVGESRNHKQIIHLVGAKPNDLQSLTQDIFAYMERVHASNVPAIVQAAAVAFGFVFVHPLEDGNGRTHRYLIHHILTREKYTPQGIIFPISAAILNDQASYDTCLETFSSLLLKRVLYNMDNKGEMRVTTENTADFYRYFNGTPIAEYLAKMIEKTAREEILQEVAFIELFDGIKADLQGKIHGLSDKGLEIAIKIAHQNGGYISKRKSDRIFAALSDADRHLIEASYAKHAYDIQAAGLALPQPEF